MYSIGLFWPMSLSQRSYRIKSLHPPQTTSFDWYQFAPRRTPDDSSNDVVPVTRYSRELDHHGILILWTVSLTIWWTSCTTGHTSATTTATARSVGVALGPAAAPSYNAPHFVFIYERMGRDANILSHKTNLKNMSLIRLLNKRG